jgi:hypothetical protein
VQSCCRRRVLFFLLASENLRVADGAKVDVTQALLNEFLSISLQVSEAHQPAFAADVADAGGDVELEKQRVARCERRHNKSKGAGSE